MRGSSGSTSRQDDARSDAAILGIDLDAVFGGEAQGQEDIWAWHLPALEAFYAISSQWRTEVVHNRVVPLGLDYTAAQVGLQLSGLSIDAATWNEVKTIAQGALDEFRRTM